MFSSIAGLIGGAVSAAGNLWSTAGDIFSSYKASEDSKEIARENRRWMERMSNTAHQREVKDLRAAGLNPILSATGGSGASTPSASTSADIKTPDLSGLSNLGNGLLSAMQVESQIKKTDAEIANIESSTAYNNLRSRQQAFENLVSSARASVASAKTKAEKDHAEGMARKVIAQAMQEELRSKTLREGDKAYLDKQERAKGRDPGNISIGSPQYGQVSVPAWMVTEFLERLSSRFSKGDGSVRFIDPEKKKVFKNEKSVYYPQYIYW